MSSNNLNDNNGNHNSTFTLLMVQSSLNGPIAQLDRASDFESEGWAFESLWDHQISANAQFGAGARIQHLLLTFHGMKP